MATKPSRPRPPKPPEGYTLAKDLHMRARRWLWRGMLPAGKFVLLGGHPGAQKTTVALDLIAQVTRGMLDGDFYGQPKGAVIFSEEDSYEEDLRPYLEAAGADLTKVAVVDVGRDFVLPDNLDELTTACDAVDAALVLFDPLLSYVNRRGSLQHNYHHTIHSLRPVAAFCQQQNVTIVGIAHTSKGSSLAGIDSFIGSRGITSTARVVLVCGILPSGDGVIGVVKANKAVPGYGHVFRTESVDVARDRNIKRWIDARKVTWVRPALSSEVEAALKQSSSQALDAAMLVLLRLLQDGKPHRHDEVIPDMQKALGRGRATVYAVIRRAVPTFVVRSQKGRGGDLTGWLTLTPAGAALLSEGDDDEDFIDDVDEGIERLQDGQKFRPLES